MEFDKEKELESLVEILVVEAKTKEQAYEIMDKTASFLQSIYEKGIRKGIKLSKDESNG